MPRMHGRPPHWSGLIVIRSSKLAISSPPSIAVTRLVYLAFDISQRSFRPDLSVNLRDVRHDGLNTDASITYATSLPGIVDSPSNNASLLGSSVKIDCDTG